MWRTGGWQDHLLDVERHNSAGCFFKLLDKPSENSYSFLKINMDHIPHQKAALGSPEVYSPGILRCFGFSGEDMVLWESSVYGKRMAFTWQGEEPAAKLTHFCTVYCACQCYGFQTFEENLFWFLISFWLQQWPSRIYNVNTTRWLSCVKHCKVSAHEWGCFHAWKTCSSRTSCTSTRTLLWEEKVFFLPKCLCQAILPWTRFRLEIFRGSNWPAYWHLTPKIGHLHVSGVSTSAHLLGENFS